MRTDMHPAPVPVPVLTDEREIMRLLRALECLDVEANETRAVKGAAQYGALEIDADPRDFLHEASEELIDARFYLAAEAIRLRRYTQAHAVSFAKAPKTARRVEEHVNTLLSAILTIDATLRDITESP